MPTEEENLQYLYLVLTHAGPPVINWTPISTALALSAGATSKRWQRLRQALDAGKPAGKGSYELLWLCVRHSSRDKALDWKAIASACGTTPGAASKRYSRMKAAWDAEPSTSTSTSSTPTADPSTTPKKTKTTGAAKTTATPPAPKRKRAPVTGQKAKKNAGEGDKYKPSDDDEEDDESPSPPKKRARAPASTRKGTSGTVVKSEPDSDVDDGEDADADADALPTPASSGSYVQNGGWEKGQQGDAAFRGFAGGQNQAVFQGFRDDGDGDGEGDAGQGEEWYESSEHLGGEGGVDERVSGWLEEI